MKSVAVHFLDKLFNGHVISSLYKTQSTNFISLFLHNYMPICNSSLAEVIFYIFGTKTSKNHLIKLINIANTRYLRCCTFQLISTNGHEVYALPGTRSTYNCQYIPCPRDKLHRNRGFRKYNIGNVDISVKFLL